MAGGRKIQADYDQLEQAASLFAQQSQQSQQLIQSVSRVVSALQSGGWVGQGAQTFFSEMEELVFPALKRLADGLELSGQSTTRIAQTLRQAEAEAARCFDGDSDGNQSKKKIGDVKITGTETPLAPTLFAKGTGDANDIDPNDVSQGNVGDCYVMAGLGEIAAQKPDIIRNAIHDNGDGTYTVTLYEKEGFGPWSHYEPTKVTVNAEFPTGVIVKDGKEYPTRPHADYGDGTGTQTEIWPTIMEKAYAQYKGGYDKMGEGGWSSDVYTALTGVPSETHGPTHYSIDELAKMHSDGELMTIATSKDSWLASKFQSDWYQSQGFPGSHEFYITGVDTKAGTVTLQNPWGWKAGGIVVPYDELDNFKEMYVNPGK